MLVAAAIAYLLFVAGGLALAWVALQSSLDWLARRQELEASLQGHQQIAFEDPRAMVPRFVPAHPASVRPVPTARPRPTRTPVPALAPTAPGESPVPSPSGGPAEPEPTPDALAEALQGLPTPSGSPIPEETPAPLPDWQGTDRINILLLGLDQRDDERELGLPTRSDTIIVVSIDPQTRSAAMISFPRDLWVEIPGFASERINVAHALGEAYKVPGGGPKLTERTIEANFGINLHYFARVDFRGFETLVDTLGGVLIDVERPISDDEYPTPDYGIKRLFIPAGLQLMNGQRALEYARSRHSDSDFGRMRRQQQVLLGMRDRALQIGILPKVPSLLQVAQQAVTTDLKPFDLLALAKLAQTIDRDGIATLVIDANYADPFVGAQGQQLLRPRKEAIRAAVAQLLTDPRLKREAVLNGSGRAGLATSTASVLAERGFDIVLVDTADRADYPTSLVRVANGKRYTAVTLANILHLPAEAIHEVEPSSEQAPDVEVVLGQDFTPPQ